MNNLEEVWVKIKLNERYEVSNFGRVRSFNHNNHGYTVLNYTNHFKYVRVGIHLGLNKYKHLYAHRLVAEYFIPNPDNKPCVLHKDNDPYNNHVDNLRWGTHAENMQQASEDKLFKSKGRPKLSNIHVSVIREAVSDGFKISKIARYFGVHHRTIWSIKTNRSWL